MNIPEFMDRLNSAYNTLKINTSQSGFDEDDLSSIFYELMIEQAQNQLTELKERQVAKLRSINYKAYLRTEHWKTVRKTMLDFAGHRCQLCNADNRELHVHHRSYENRGRETHSDLIVLCADCHGQFHDKLELSK